LRFLADNQSLLSGLQDQQRPSSVRQCLQPEHELLQATMKNVSRSSSVVFQHVKGHQLPEASPEAGLNHKCDELATTARTLPLPPGIANITHRTATLVLNGMEVSSKYADHLRHAYSSQSLRKYYMGKFPNWNNKIIDTIDWYIKGRALGLLSGRTQKTVLQLLHGWLPVNSHPSVNKVSPSTHCPYCQESSETFEHLLSCQHPQAVQHHNTMVEAVQMHLTKSKTNQHLAHLVLSSFHTCQIIPSIPVLEPLVKSQTAIGMSHILKGNLSLEWVRVYDKLHTNGSGEKWCISLLKTIWTSFYCLWKKRCDYTHGVTQSEFRSNLLREMTPRIDRLYATQSQLLHIDRFFFHHPQEKVLQLSNSRLQTWVHKAEGHVKAALLRAKRETQKQNTKVTSFFPIFTAVSQN
jgi:hypothetical protein